MKRTIIICWASFFLTSSSFSQLGRIGGSLRYEHQYQDVLVNGSLLTSLRMSPSINLNTEGFISSENFIFFTLRTALNSSFRTGHSASSVIKTKQYLWNAYDVNVFFFQIAPANLQFSMREYVNDIRYEYQGLKSRSGTRNHETMAGFALVRVPYMPQVNFSYRRNRSWSIVGEDYNTRSDQYVFAASSKNGTSGHASVTGSVSDFYESFTNFSERIATLQFDGSNVISDGHQLTIGSEYNRYGRYSTLSGGVAYAGLLSDRVQLYSNVNGQNASGWNYSFYSGNTSGNLQFTMDEHFRYGVGLSGGRGSTVTTIEGYTRSVESYSVSGNVNLNHTRTLGSVNFMNNLSLAYGRRRYYENSSFHRVGFNNSANRAIGRFTVNAVYNFSFLTNKTTLSWQSIENFAMLAATGVLPASIRTRTSADFRSYTYKGGAFTAPDLSMANIMQTLEGPFKLVIPFTLGAGVTVHYYFTGLSGHAYGWNVTFQSARFFADGLSASYRYARDYDPYYRMESIDQTASLYYRWRLLSIQVSLRESWVFNRTRDARFTLERSF